MRLSEWLAAQGKGSKTRLARAADVAYTTILDIEAGRATPRVKTARRIELATDGQVTVRELLGLTETEAA